MDGSINWPVGSSIIIASSSKSKEQSEVVKITGVTGKTIQFTPTLSYSHYGAIDTYGGKTINLKAQVGLM